MISLLTPSDYITTRRTWLDILGTTEKSKERVRFGGRTVDCTETETPMWGFFDLLYATLQDPSLLTTMLWERIPFSIQRAI